VEKYENHLLREKVWQKLDSALCTNWLHAAKTRQPGHSKGRTI